MTPTPDDTKAGEPLSIEKLDQVFKEAEENERTKRTVFLTSKAELDRYEETGEWPRTGIWTKV